MHRLGWLLAFAVLVQFPYRLLSLRRPDQPPVPRAVTMVFLWGLVLSIIVNRVVNQVV